MFEGTILRRRYHLAAESPREESQRRCPERTSSRCAYRTPAPVDLLLLRGRSLRLAVGVVVRALPCILKVSINGAHVKMLPKDFKF